MGEGNVTPADILRHAKAATLINITEAEFGGTEKQRRHLGLVLALFLARRTKNPVNALPRASLLSNVSRHSTRHAALGCRSGSHSVFSAACDGIRSCVLASRTDSQLLVRCKCPFLDTISKQNCEIPTFNFPSPLRNVVTSSTHALFVTDADQVVLTNE